MVVSVPKHTTCRSVPETMVNKLLVGAFETVVEVARVPVPTDVSQ